MGLVNLPTNLVDRVVKLERGLEAVRKLAGLTSAIIRRGGLTLLEDSFIKVVDDTNTTIVYIGPDVDGKQIVRLRREGGSNVLYTYTHINGQQFWALTDRGNRILASDDAATGVGLARPWLAVPMHKLFNGPAGVHQYATVDAAAISTEKQLWEGRIPLVSHPRIELYGVWGQASGANNTTFRLLVNGTQVGTWSVNGALQNTTQGPFDMTAFIEQPNVQVSLMARASGTGEVAAGLLGCWQRQSP